MAPHEAIAVSIALGRRFAKPGGPAIIRFPFASSAVRPRVWERLRDPKGSIGAKHNPSLELAGEGIFLCFFTKAFIILQKLQWEHYR